MMTVADQPLVELVRQLPPDIALEVRHYIEFLLERRHKAPTQSVEPVARGWPTGFFEATAGSIPDFPDINRDGDGIDPHLDEIAHFNDDQETSS